MGYIGNQITTVFPTSISVDSATISGNASVGGTLGVTGVSTLSDNVVFDASSKGVHLGVTSATASNLLDDYEEGTWTPTVAQGTVTVANAYYIKVGNKVTLWAKISSFSDRSTVSPVNVTGLPFTPSTSADDNCIGSAMWAHTSTNGSAVYVGSISIIQFYAGTSSGAYASVKHSNLTNQASEVYMTATYGAS